MNGRPLIRQILLARVGHCQGQRARQASRPLSCRTPAARSGRRARPAQTPRPRTRHDQRRALDDPARARRVVLRNRSKRTAAVRGDAACARQAAADARGRLRASCAETRDGTPAPGAQGSPSPADRARQTAASQSVNTPGRRHTATRAHHELVRYRRPLSPWGCTQHFRSSINWEARQVAWPRWFQLSGRCWHSVD